MGDAANHPSNDLGCGRCGYPICGLASTICPECGADRRVVGVRHARAELPARVRQAIAAVLWTIGFVAVAAILWQQLLPLMPRDLSNHRDYTLLPRNGDRPPMELRRIGYGWGWPSAQGPSIRPAQGTLHARTPGLRQAYVLGELSFRRDTGDASYAATRFDGAGHAVLPAWAGRLDEAALARWLVLVGASEEDARAEAAELLPLMMSPTFDPREADALRRCAVSVTGGVEATPPKKAEPALAALLTLLWGVGLWLAVRRHRPRPYHGTGSPLA